MPPLTLDKEDQVFLDKIKNLVGEIAHAYNSFHLRKASQLIMELATCGNVYFDRKKPWVLVKDPSTTPAMQTAIGCCIECLKALALVSSPIIPATSQKLWELIGYSTELSTLNWSDIMDEPMKTGTPLPDPAPLFKKVEDEVVEKEENLLKENLPKPDTNYEPLKEEITFEDFAKIDLRVGEILTVESVPKSKKLLKLSVDLGFETRTIVSGISPYFEDPQTLMGKKVIIVANLKSAKLMGIESQGMLIVVNMGEKIEMPIFSEAPPGDQVS